MDKLKPCPFCGGEAEILHVRSGYSANPTTIRDEFKAGCKSCEMYTKLYTTNIWIDEKGVLHNEYNGAENATKAWNRRAE